MPKYLIQCNYTGQGIKGLLKEGGKVEAFYYAFGETDLFVIAEAPDDATMTAILLTIVDSGSLTLKTTVLIPPEEVDAAVKKHPSYRPPGQ